MPTFPSYTTSYPPINIVTESNLLIGDFVIIDKVAGGSAKVKKAVIDSYNTYYGFVLNNYLVGQTAQVFLLGQVNNGLSGLVPGATYYADPVVPGGVTNIIPTTTKVIQLVGKALTTTYLDTQYAKLLDGTGGGGGGTVLSVTGLDTDNTDPANPIVKISVDGVTIIGQGTPASPLVAIGGGGVTHEVLIDGGTFVGTTGTTLVDAGTFI